MLEHDLENRFPSPIKSRTCFSGSCPRQLLAAVSIQLSRVARTVSLADPAHGVMIAAAGIRTANTERPMRRLALFAASLAVLAAGGCATEVGPSPAELKANWEAQNIPPQSYKQDLIAYMRTYLNDPSGIREAAVSQPALKDFGPAQRFMTCVRFNARKTDGK